MAQPAQSIQQAVRRALHLYRDLLRLHRHKLPGPMRELGDAHVRSEFAAHLRRKEPLPEHQFQQFMSGWKGYLAMLQPEAPLGHAGVGASSQGVGGAAHEQREEAGIAAGDVRLIAEDLDAHLSPEQQLRMSALRKEASKLGQGIHRQLQQAEQDKQQQPPHQ